MYFDMRDLYMYLAEFLENDFVMLEFFYCRDMIFLDLS